MPPPAPPDDQPGEYHPSENRPAVNHPHALPLPHRALTATRRATSRALATTTRALTRIGLPTRADHLLVAAAAALFGWAGVSAIAHGGAGSFPWAYLTAPVLLLLGVLAGRTLAARTPGRFVATGAAVLALVVLFAVPFYANAQAALGIQLVALTGLVALADTGPSTDPSPTPHKDPSPAPPHPAHPHRLTLPLPALMALVLGTLLAARAQAGTALVVAVAAVVALALTHRTRPARRRLTAPRTVVTAGSVVITAAALAVLWLGTRGAWPSLLTSSGSLSSTRHMLWGDALKLWAHSPVLGSGPGSFLEASPLAGSRAHLHEAHSSILQVGAELGILGALLFLALLAAGLGVAAHQRGPAALVSAAAWTALAVHSMIDHLYEFPPVTVAAGLVLGYGLPRAARRAPTTEQSTHTAHTPRTP